MRSIDDRVRKHINPKMPRYLFASIDDTDLKSKGELR